MLIPGHATPEGTARFRDRFAAEMPAHFGEAGGLWLSSIGLGTYLGAPTTAADVRYREAVALAVKRGANVLDTAVNYRHQRSERAIASALAELLAEGAAQRDELFVASKGGFLCFDGEEPDDPTAYFEEKLLRPGIVRPEEVAAGCHVMSPKYLAHQIEVSRRNLGLETLDLYYLHNPETQLGDVTREEFSRRLKAAFAVLEKAVGEGKIRAYGAATWTAFRVPSNAPDALSLAEVLTAARQVGGEDHHFRAVQLPFNLAMREALAANTQTWQEKDVPFLLAARNAGIMVFASASLLQGKLSNGRLEEIARWSSELRTDSQRALQFVRSTPGVTCALVGMSQTAHVEENLATARVPRLSLKEFRAMFTR
jgi:aryl-alcohol dehydrogenase-like predicted oxidoreductase